MSEQVKQSEQEVKATKATPKADSKGTGKVAVLLIRGLIGMHYDVKHTLDLMKIRKKHTLVILDDNHVTRGMLKIVKDYVTFGEIDAETLKLLQKKDNGKGFYSMHPPRGGYEKGGIKKNYKQGGALGNRGAKINDLIKRMI